MKTLSSMLPLLALFSCSTLNRNQYSAPVHAVVEAGLKADVAVDMTKKLTGMATSSTLFGILELSGPNKFADGVFASNSSFLSFGTSGDDLKAAAAYNAVTGKADVIVAPQYVMQKKSYLIYSTTTVVVTGYPGTIKKIQ